MTVQTHVFASADNVPLSARKLLTPGKSYLVHEDMGPGFTIIADDGEPLSCLWDGCGQINGGSWRRRGDPYTSA